MVGKIKSKVDMDKIQKHFEKTGSYTKTAIWATNEFGVKVSPQNVRIWLTYEPAGPKQEKILLFDIETAPMLVYTWGLFKQNIDINQIKEDWYVLMWSAKWLGSDDIYFDALNQHRGKKREKKVVESLWNLLDEADIIVAQNGKNFDIKKMNAKFIEYDMPAPSHYKVVDTLKIAQANFGFSSHKLDYMGDLLVGSKKNKTDFSLWLGCMEDDETSWSIMIDYCVQDVNLLEQVYLKMRSWDKFHPPIVYDTVMRCNACGSEKISISGEYHTSASTFEIFRCECGHQQRARQNIALDEEKKIRQVSV